MTEDISSLTDAQLRDRLKAYDQDVPPITQSTRKTLEKRLLKLKAGTASPKQTSSVILPSASSKPRSRTTTTAESVEPTPTMTTRIGAKRTPSPPIASQLPRSTKPIPRKIPTRSGAAFSSDEEEDSVTNGAKDGTPSGGWMNGRFFRSTKAVSTDVSSSDSKSSGSGRFPEFGRFLGRSQEPKTSTPQEKRAGFTVENSFGMSPITPIRDDGMRRRSGLGRAPLANYKTEKDEIDSTKKKQNFWNRFFKDELISDPIHLTPEIFRERERERPRHSPPRPRPLQFLNTSKDEGNFFSRHSTTLIIALFAVFFFSVGGVYFAIKLNSSEVDATLTRYQLHGPTDSDVLFQCLGDEIAGPGVKCYTPNEIVAALEVSATLQKGLAKLKGEALCEGYKQDRMTVSEARTFALANAPGRDAVDFTRAVDLIIANPHWGIRALDSVGNQVDKKEDVRFLENSYAIKSFACRMKEAVASALFKIAMIIFGVAVFIAIVMYLRHFIQRRALRQEQVFEMVNRIIGAVRANYEDALKQKRASTSSAISHIRENFVPHGIERKHLLSIWNDAVDYINAHESRISLELEQINGEDFEVWNWLPSGTADSVGKNELDISSPLIKSSNVASSSNFNGTGREPIKKNRPRHWGGGPIPAKSIMPESITAATSCLKVRGMFNGVEENQEDAAQWTNEIVDAILDRCQGVARILDIAVEPTSDEGIVYIKLQSNEDARNAYMALHGQFFDARQVTVKFLKLDRYHQRFPEAINKFTPMVASKLKRRT